MSDWNNTPIRHRLDANQVNVVDTAQDAFVGTADAAYYDDVTTNASALGVPDAPASFAAADDLSSGADITWTDAGYDSDSNILYYITGTVTDIDTILASGTATTSAGSPDNIATGSGTWSFAGAGVNEFGTGPYSVDAGVVIA